MNWVPIVFIIFKVGVLGIGMFFSIKWHYDQAKSSKPVNMKRIILEAVLYLAAVIIVLGLVYSLFHYLHMLPVGTDFL
jgi:heme/copper-type cytochrome/quinol oxidase subunit 2